MRKMLLLGIIFAALITLPANVLAGGGKTKHCTTPTPPATGPTVCVDGLISFTATNYDTAYDKYIGESQLFVELQDPAVGYPPGTIGFHFFNTGPIASTITAVYFGDSIPLFDYANAIIDDGLPGVEFSSPATPAGMPGNVSFPAVMFSADADPPPAGYGVDPGEYLDIILYFEDGYGYDELIEALADGSMSLGLHVQSLGTSGNSIKMISRIDCLPGPGPGPTPIPEPATMLLLGTGLIGVAGVARRRKK